MQNFGYTQRATLTETDFLGAKLKLCLKKETLPALGTDFFWRKTEVIPKGTANRDSFSWCKTKVTLKGTIGREGFHNKNESSSLQEHAKEEVYSYYKIEVCFFKDMEPERALHAK